VTKFAFVAAERRHHAVATLCRIAITSKSSTIGSAYDTAALASSRVRKLTWWTCSFFSKVKKLSCPFSKVPDA
jgi:hypothetical protein